MARSEGKLELADFIAALAAPAPAVCCECRSRVVVPASPGERLGLCPTCHQKRLREKYRAGAVRACVLCGRREVEPANVANGKAHALGLCGECYDEVTREAVREFRDYTDSLKETNRLKTAAVRERSAAGKVAKPKEKTARDEAGRVHWLLQVSACSALVGSHASNLTKWAQVGRLPSYRLGGSRWFDPVEVEQVLKGGLQGPFKELEAVEVEPEKGSR